HASNVRRAYEDRERERWLQRQREEEAKKEAVAAVSSPPHSDGEVPASHEGRGVTGHTNGSPLTPPAASRPPPQMTGEGKEEEDETREAASRRALADWWRRWPPEFGAKPFGFDDVALPVGYGES